MDAMERARGTFQDVLQVRSLLEQRLLRADYRWEDVEPKRGFHRFGYPKQAPFVERRCDELESHR